MKVLCDRRRIILKICCSLISGMLLFSSCQKKEPASPAPNRSTIFNVYLSDAPAYYKAVRINIQEIWVNATDSVNSGWLQVPLTRPGQFNLLDFQNGKDTLLATKELPSGTITRLRLVLGDNNHLVLNDGTVAPLALSSKEPATIKVNVNEELMPGVPYNLVMDFNLAASITQEMPGGDYIFKPVIRTFKRGSGGAIEGVVLPDSARTHVLAATGTDTLSTIPDSSGYYKFSGLPEGTYVLLFVPNTPAFQRDTLDSIPVIVGQTIQADTVRLEPQSWFLSY